MDVSRFRTVGEWYREFHGRVPIQMAAGLDRIMREEGVTFPRAYELAVERGQVIHVDPEPVADGGRPR